MSFKVVNFVEPRENQTPDKKPKYYVAIETYCLTVSRTGEGGEHVFNTFALF